MDISTRRTRVIAVLGPTNTGKTYLALERMLGHGSGIMGFPLRLLARENYDRAVKLKSRREVALITGEEKIVPPYAKYIFCTVESMPLDLPTAFLAVDEIQLCADPERGHIFMDRLLNARGTEETMFMGAETVKPLIRRLVPEAEFLTRPRFSKITYTGAKKIGRMIPRSAVVGFSAADVYSMAELLRRQRGGAAIVMGALSPRTRNAQVQMFQEGEVDHLVATDAIGMGLNLEIDHVAFAAVRKFDGNGSRNLRPEELAQIAGRAGRHMSDGTFGVTAEVTELPADVVERIEDHNFQSISAGYWRNPQLEFSSYKTLRDSLERPSESPLLIKVRNADDERFLNELTADPEIAARAMRESETRLLWEVCQVPDFRKIASDSHTGLLSQIYKFLVARNGMLPVDWMARQINRINQTDGDIDTLLGRIANIRIWTYVSHRSGWLDDPEHWQAMTREIEDRLSDALHERLTQRFVDQRATALVRGLRERNELCTEITADGEVSVEGYDVGRLNGFRFQPDPTGGHEVDRTVMAAAVRSVGGRIDHRVRTLCSGPDAEIRLADDGVIHWREEAVARLSAGTDALHPKITTLQDDLLDGPARIAVETHLRGWLDRLIKRALGPIVRLREAPLTGPARGVAFQLTEALGSVTRRQVETQLKGLQKADYGKLRGLGVRLGRDHIYIPVILKPAAARTAALLWAVQAGLSPMPDLPPPGRASLPYPKNTPAEFLAVTGYRRLGTLAVRLDIIERLHGLLRKAAASGKAEIGADVLNLVGCTTADMAGVLEALGYSATQNETGLAFALPVRKKRSGPRKAKRKKPLNQDSPFAILKDLAVS
ncbi:MAG: helicase-related protein [Proteobacteria bacterium]|nr:helicase-related protein [Pseudomonadota bacterium]